MADNELKAFSKRLRSLRKEAGMTQEDLATKADISVKYLQNLEGPRPKNLSLLTLARLAKGLGVAIGSLLE